MSQNLRVLSELRVGLISRRHKLADDCSVRAQQAVYCLDFIPDDFGEMIDVRSFNKRDNVKHPCHGMSGSHSFNLRKFFSYGS